MTVVLYGGSWPGITDLIAGNVAMMIDSVASALPHIRAGRVKASAVTTRARISAFPDVPTIAETLSPG